MNHAFSNARKSFENMLPFLEIAKLRHDKFLHKGGHKTIPHLGDPVVGFCPCWRRALPLLKSIPRFRDVVPSDGYLYHRLHHPHPLVKRRA